MDEGRGNGLEKYAKENYLGSFIVLNEEYELGQTINYLIRNT